LFQHVAWLCKDFADRARHGCLELACGGGFQILALREIHPMKSMAMPCGNKLQVAFFPNAGRRFLDVAEEHVKPAIVAADRLEGLACLAGVEHETLPRIDERDFGARGLSLEGKLALALAGDHPAIGKVPG